MDSSIILGNPPVVTSRPGWDGAISVFNELFVDGEIKIESDGIAAVLLFGSDIGLRESILAKKSQLEDAKTARLHTESHLESSAAAEVAAQKALEKKLKTDWASRSRRILQSTNATTSWKATLEDIQSAKKPEGNLTELITALEERIARHETLSRSEEITPGWNILSKSDLLRRMDTGLLREVIEIPSGEGLRSKVAESLKGNEDLVRKALNTFSTPGSAHCPMCQQDLGAAYRDELIDSIQQSLSGEGDEFARRLESAKINELPLAIYSADPRVGDDLIEMFRADVEKFNEKASRWNDAVERKKTQMYAPIKWDSSGLVEAAERLAASMAIISERYSDWNKEVARRQLAQQELMADNSNIARLELDREIDEWSKAKRLLTAAQEGYGQSLEDEVRAREEFANLQMQSSNPQEAVDIINRHLRSIFADAGRMKLEVLREGDEISVARYGIIGRGVRLRPEDLSVGERNILALSYFFARVRRQVDDAPDGQPHLAVLDDPISSVDVDNRLGIHGFLEARMREYVGRSPLARMLFMTHDLTAARDFQKSAVAAMESMTSKSIAKKSVRGFMLEAGPAGSNLRELSERQLESLDEYQNLMAVMYSFANVEQDGDVDRWQSLVIGNVVRRVLEAFSTFIYKSGILDPILFEEYSSMYPGRELDVDMRAGHRGFLHDSSHSQDRITSIRDYGGMAGITDREKITHVQRILALMFALQETHMRQYLPAGADGVVAAWKADLVGE